MSLVWRLTIIMLLMVIHIKSFSSRHWSHYLNYDGSGDGVIASDDKPSVDMNFGIYRGNEQTLHWREVFN